MAKIWFNLPIIKEGYDSQEYVVRHWSGNKWRNLFYSDQPLDEDALMKIWRALGHNLREGEYLVCQRFKGGRFGEVIARVPRLPWDALRGKKKKQLVKVGDFKVWQILDPEVVDKELLSMQKHVRNDDEGYKLTWPFIIGIVAFLFCIATIIFWYVF